MSVAGYHATRVRRNFIIVHGIIDADSVCYMQKIALKHALYMLIQ